MKLAVILFPLCALLVFAPTSTYSASISQVFSEIGFFKAALSSAILNGTNALLNYKDLLDIAVSTFKKDIQFVTINENMYSNHLISLENQALNQSLNISDCISIRQFLHSYTSTLLTTLNSKISTFNTEETNSINSAINGINSWNTSVFLTNASNCNSDSTCLSQVVSDISTSLGVSKNYIKDLTNDYNTTIFGDIESTSEAISSLIYSGIQEIVVIYNTALECLSNAGLSNDNEYY